MPDHEIKRRKPKERRKTDYIRARVTEAHKALMQKAADEAGIPLSSWIVDRLLRVAREEIGG